MNDKVEPNIVLLGPGIFYAAQLATGKLPDTVEVSCNQLLDGQYRLTRNGERMWGSDQKYPFYNYERIGDRPDDAEITPLQMLSV